MTSVICLPRSDLALCDPRTHVTASTIFDLPDPFGPPTTLMPGGNSIRVLSAKLLKPNSSRALSMRGVESFQSRVKSQNLRALDSCLQTLDLSALSSKQLRQ